MRIDHANKRLRIVLSTFHVSNYSCMANAGVKITVVRTALVFATGRVTPVDRPYQKYISIRALRASACIKTDNSTPMTEGWRRGEGGEFGVVFRVPAPVEHENRASRLGRYGSNMVLLSILFLSLPPRTNPA